MVKDTFKQFVDQKVSEVSGDSVNWEDEKDFWIKQLNMLSVKVSGWLAPYTKDGSVTLKTDYLTLEEENIGRYAAPMPVIKIGNSVVTLEPIGTLLIGARGRVDMKGPKGVARLVIVPKDSTKPRVQVQVGSPNMSATPKPAAPPVDEWVWKIASSPPRITYTELTEESFLDVLMGVANG